MPEKATMEPAKRDKQQGKAPTTQAGEFVREEIHHIREGEHGARSAKQAIAIGLSKARKAGVDLPPRAGDDAAKKPSTSTKSSQRSSATLNALRKEPHESASKKALSEQAQESANKRSAEERSTAARKAVRTRKEENSANRNGCRTSHEKHVKAGQQSHKRSTTARSKSTASHNSHT